MHFVFITINMFLFNINVIIGTLLLLDQVFTLNSIQIYSAAKSHLLSQIKVSSSADEQVQAVENLIGRLLPNNTNNFAIFVNFNLKQIQNGIDIFRLKRTPYENKVYIEGSSGVAVSAGLHYYLKYFCNCHISWETVQLNLPDQLPLIDTEIILNDPFRYYQNICTPSYSFVWWSWAEWEKHIDWMALNGINLPLALTGEEAIWNRVYKKYFNLTDNDVQEYFTGPAFLAWGRMSNIRGWGGPLTDVWHNASIILQKQILKRMREFGMYPVLPGFAGSIPKALKRIYPNAKITAGSRWNNFNDQYCCPDILDPSDSLFKHVGKLYLRELISEFGTNHLYSADPFNEITPSNGSTAYLNEFSRAILKVMMDVDTKSVWLLQNWFFLHEAEFWTKERIQAFLYSIPMTNLLILDLMSEQYPQYDRLDSYYGHFYIWCMLHNFGGTIGMFGAVPTINEEIFKARKKINGTMIGSGLTMEGINQNYVVYDFMTEMFWRKKSVDLTEWYCNYTNRRYGHVNNHTNMTWQILKNTVYNYNIKLVKNHNKYVINRRPNSNIAVWYWYDIKKFMEAWNQLILAAEDFYYSESYLYDLVDVTRQALQIFTDQYFMKLMQCFQDKKTNKFQEAMTIFMDIFNDMDRVLKTNKAFLLGNWLEAAKRIGRKLEVNDTSLYEFNARNQITLWGPSGEIVDYASKQWAGIVSDYFAPRWKIFLSAMNTSLVTKTRFNESKVRQTIFNQVELPFTLSQKNYTTIPEEFTIEVVKQIHKKWWESKRHLILDKSATKNLCEDEEQITSDWYQSTPTIVVTKK